jgi:hypothetical protein
VHPCDESEVVSSGPPVGPLAAQRALSFGREWRPLVNVRGAKTLGSLISPEPP